jgi:hypothetical protein
MELEPNGFGRRGNAMRLVSALQSMTGSHDSVVRLMTTGIYMSTGERKRGPTGSQ